MENLDRLRALQALRGFIFDMDGVIYRGDSALPGAAEFVARLRARGIPYNYLTNNSTTPPAKVAERLVRMGIPCEPHEILTSAEVTAAALKEELPGCRVFVVGEEGIELALAQAGFRVTTDHREADAVVLGMDRTLTYARLRDASFAVRRGARFMATNNDRTLPSDIGIIPGAGSLLIALETASDVRATVIGKPSPVIFRHALARLGTPAQVTACVGDRPETDIEGGHAIGLCTIGVLSGVGDREGFAALSSPPDYIFEDLADLARAYFRD